MKNLFKPSFISICNTILFIISLSYYFLIKNLSNSYIWLIVGLFFLAIALFWNILSEKTKIRNIIYSFVVVFSLVFLSFTFRIALNMNGNPIDDMDYVIVLGAQVKGTIPSTILKERCDAAYKYLQDNPNSKAILAGGQGDGEYITEAEAMYRYLVNKGIDKKRLIKEERSTNTISNIEYSITLLKEKGVDITELSVGIVSSDFHLKRARYILSNNNTELIHCISSKTDTILLPHYLLRETFALIKEYFYYI